MARPSDCIFCGADTGSREHTFPAALGGRRVNKGILCGACNQKFSPLDAELSKQLEFFNGLIGVRPDHSKSRRMANVESVDGAITIDDSGKPALAAPHVLTEEVRADGRRVLEIEFADEQQVQEWVASQRAAGVEVVTQERRAEGERFLSKPTRVPLTFGGPNIFREVGRIALNFLAYRWPAAARDPGLKRFKNWVEGLHILVHGDPRWVWYAPPEAFDPPDARFKFGHQVLVSLDEQTSYARIRFFSTFDLFVFFGAIPSATPGVTVYDIDPLADHPPMDLERREVNRCLVPASPKQPNADTRDLSELLKTRLQVLFALIDDHHWTNATLGLLDELNAVRELAPQARPRKVAELLKPHRGYVLALIRLVAEEFCRSTEGDVRMIADFTKQGLAPDEAGNDGLSDLSRALLVWCVNALANEIVKELAAMRLTEARLRLLLTGPAGVGVVGRVLADTLSLAWAPLVR